MLKLQPKTLFVGQNQVFLPYCHSTNDIAAELGQKEDFKNGTIVITDFQTNGRGQRGTKWLAQEGKGILISFLLETSFLAIQRQFELSMMVALSVVDALKKQNVSGVQIKWPNDIYINEQKLGGILIENSIKGNKLDFSVLGIGINLNNSNLDGVNYTWLNKENQNLSKNTAIETMCESLEKYYLDLKSGFDFKEKYLNNLLGYRVERYFYHEEIRFKGRIVDVEENGFLKIESDLEKNTFDIKEISFEF